MTIEIIPQRRLAVWYQCPECKATYGRSDMDPTERNAKDVGMCVFCEVQEVIVRRRYYTVWASDFYGTAGTCKEVCEYSFPNIRAFKKWLAEKTAQREQEAKEYFEHEHHVRAEYEARLKKEREEAALLKEVERIVYQATYAVELEAEQVAKAVWIELKQEERLSSNDDLDDSGSDDGHPF